MLLLRELPPRKRLRRERSALQLTRPALREQGRRILRIPLPERHRRRRLFPLRIILPDRQQYRQAGRSCFPGPRCQAPLRKRADRGLRMGPSTPPRRVLPEWLLPRTPPRLELRDRPYRTGKRHPAEDPPPKGRKERKKASRNTGSEQAA